MKSIITTVLCLLLFSCSKSDKIVLSEEASHPYTPLDFTNFNLGEAHNQSVLTAFQHIKKQRLAANVSPESFTQADVYAEYYNQIKKLDCAPLGISNDSLYVHVIKLNQRLALAGYDLRNLSQPKSGLSPVAYKFISGFFNDISEAKSLSVIESSIARFKTKAAAELNDLDKDIATGTLSVALSSAQLWYGDDPIIQLMRKRSNKPAAGTSQRPPNWVTKMILGDASGSAGFFAIMGWGAAMGMGVPGANAVIFGTWAMSAGLTSVTALAGFFTVPWEELYPGKPNPFVEYPDLIIDPAFWETFIANENATP